MKNEHSLDSLLQGTAEIEEFLHALLIAMAKRRHKPGEDVTKFASEPASRFPKCSRERRSPFSAPRRARVRRRQKRAARELKPWCSRDLETLMH